MSEAYFHDLINVSKIDFDRAENCKNKVADLITSEKGLVIALRDAIETANTTLGVRTQDFHNGLYVENGTEYRGTANPILRAPAQGVPPCPANPYREHPLDVQAWLKYLYHGCKRYEVSFNQRRYLTDSEAFFKFFNVYYNIHNQHRQILGDYGNALFDAIRIRNNIQHAPPPSGANNDYERAKWFYNTARFILIPLCIKNWAHRDECIKLYNQFEETYYSNIGELFYNIEGILKYADIPVDDMDDVQELFICAGLTVENGEVAVLGNPVRFAHTLSKAWKNYTYLEARVAALMSGLPAREKDVVSALMVKQNVTKLKTVSFESLQLMVDDNIPEAQLELAVRLYSGTAEEDEYDDNKITELLKKASDAGLGEAKARLAHKMLKNRTASNDEIKEAFSLLAQAEGMGCPYAHYVYGLVAFDGLAGEEENRSEAYKSFKKGAELGCTEAKLYQVYCEAKENDFEKISMAYLSRIENIANEIDSGYAHNFLGWCYNENKQYAEAFNCFKKAADRGYIVAEFNLGKCYMNGRGTKKDPYKSSEHFKKAAERGHLSAKYYLAINYYYGNDTKEDEEKAFDMFKELSQVGHIGAKSLLAECYYYGYGTEKNEKNAFLISKSAAENNEDTDLSNCILGLCYGNGRGTEKKPVLAFECFKKAAENNYGEAEKALGYCYEKGHGTEKNPALALEYFKKAADKGYTEAEFKVALYYHNGIATDKNLSLAFEYYKKAADKGYEKAEYNLGLYYKNGWNVEKDPEKAVIYFKRAADNGIIQAEYQLGLYYANKQSADYNPSLAFEYYKKAADKGHDESQYQVSLCFEEGNGTNKDDYFARIYLAMASENGNVTAKFKLAKYYYDTLDTADHLKAFKMFKELSQDGHNGAKGMLAECYYYGTGANQDDSKAFMLAKEAASFHDNNAQNILGLCYINARGTTRNPSKGFSLFEEAARDGHSSAAYHLGWCYEHGVGTDKNAEKALFWYKRAADKVHYDAILKVGQLYEEGIGTVVNIEKAIHYYNQLTDFSGGEGEYRLGKLYRKEGEKFAERAKIFQPLAENLLQKSKKYYEEAFEYLEYAAEYNHKDALYELAVCYDKGIGTEKDAKWAFRYYKKAEEKGNVEATKRLSAFGKK